MNGVSAFCSSISCKKNKKLSCKALKNDAISADKAAGFFYPVVIF